MHFCKNLGTRRNKSSFGGDQCGRMGMQHQTHRARLTDTSLLGERREPTPVGSLLAQSLSLNISAPCLLQELRAQIVLSSFFICKGQNPVLILSLILPTNLKSTSASNYTYASSLITCLCSSQFTLPAEMKVARMLFYKEAHKEEASFPRGSTIIYLFN